MQESDGMHIDNAFGYIDQLDKHAALLTVGETLEFAFQCKSGGKILREREGLTDEQLQLIEKAQQDGLSRKLMLCVLGLSEVENTFVGDTNVRGVSGGQRRRVTVGEMLMSRTPVICGDEISTGLDAASTYDMVETLLHIGRGSNFSRVFALLQPSPEVVSLFDEVVVLAEGRVIYAGPVEEVEDYFAAIGFKSPEFVDVADFLQMVSTEDRDDLYDPSDHLKDDHPSAPNITELADIFHKSEQGRRIQELLASPNKYVFKKDKKGNFLTSQDSGNMLQLEAVKKKYANQWYRSTQLISRRFLTLWVRDRKVLAFSVMRNVLNGASVGGVFFNANDFVSLQGAIFQTGIFVLLGA
jgi:ABC-type multidrug transport system ATPase subunit